MFQDYLVQQKKQQVEKVESYLYKKKSDNAKVKWMQKYIKRWFVFDLKEQNFYYLKDRNSKVPEKIVNFKDVKRVQENCEVDLGSCKFKYAFTVETYERTWVLVAQDQPIQQAFCAGLQSYLDYVQSLKQSLDMKLVYNSCQLRNRKLEQEPQSEGNQIQIDSLSQNLHSEMKSKEKKKKHNTQAKMLNMSLKVERKLKGIQEESQDSAEQESENSQQRTIKHKLKPFLINQTINSQGKIEILTPKRQVEIKENDIQPLMQIPISAPNKKTIQLSKFKQTESNIKKKQQHQENEVVIEKVTLKVKNAFRNEANKTMIIERENLGEYQKDQVRQVKQVLQKSEDVNKSFLKICNNYSVLELLQDIDILPSQRQQQVNQMKELPSKLDKQKKQKLSQGIKVSKIEKEKREKQSLSKSLLIDQNE